MKVLSRSIILLSFCFFCVFLSINARSESQKIGIVIIHGKGSLPSKQVSGLASFLEDKGYLVANIEMPWSGRRDYDVNVSTAEKEVEDALSSLRSQGAQKVFVAGHSQGGVFTLNFAGKHKIDGIICIAPGSGVGSKGFREKLWDSVAHAKQLVAEGKGDQKVKLNDYEGKKGIYSIVTTPSIYLTWFDPDGAMSTVRSAILVNPKVPILWIVAERDYPGLRKVNIPLFDTFPQNVHTQLYEPNSDHSGAPSASKDEIVRWITEVVNVDPQQ